MSLVNFNPRAVSNTFFEDPLSFTSEPPQFASPDLYIQRSTDYRLISPQQRPWTSSLFPFGDFVAGADIGPANGTIRMHNPDAEEILQQSKGADFWEEAEIVDYSEKFKEGKVPYDQIRLKPIEDGYLPAVSGVSSSNIDTLATLIFRNQHLIGPRYARVKVVVNLDQGYDETTQACYQDSIQFFDAIFFDVIFFQRMYYKKDETTGRVDIWFEKMNLDGFNLTPEQITDYLAKKEKAISDYTSRISIKQIFEPSEVFGIFSLKPTEEKKTKFDFVSQITFPDENWFVQYVSRIRAILKKGLIGAATVYNDTSIDAENGEVTLTNPLNETCLSSN